MAGIKVNRILILASAAYVDSELEAEFGKIPPSFLPLGNKRLFSRQFSAVRNESDRIFISLPDDFIPEAEDVNELQRLGVEIVAVPPGLSLGESLVYVLNVTASAHLPVAILLGDTLIDLDDFYELDVVSIGALPVSYNWGRALVVESSLIDATTVNASDAEARDFEALAGWFSFSDSQLLIQAVTRCRGNFIKALGVYSSTRALKTARPKTWLDFGHANTYHQSRRKITTEREFNRLQPTKRAVIKSSIHDKKIRAEANWFSSLPPKLKYFTPNFLGTESVDGRSQYAIEYLHLPTLTDLFVFGRLALPQWKRIFSSCTEFFSECSQYTASEEDVVVAGASLYRDKTLARLEEYAAYGGIRLDESYSINGRSLPTIRKIIETLVQRIEQSAPVELRVIHGDFCFSNILYDARSELIKVIDPRGIDTSGRFSIYGDWRYDLAKMYHSVCGRYDHIVAGYFKSARLSDTEFSLQLPDSVSLKAIQSEFMGTTFSGVGVNEASAPEICVLLFLSMLPLHSDAPKRQEAFFANALRIFSEID